LVTDGAETAFVETSMLAVVSAGVADGSADPIEAELVVLDAGDAVAVAADAVADEDGAAVVEDDSPVDVDVVGVVDVAPL
jgi:hypothetical protein